MNQKYVFCKILGIHENNEVKTYWELIAAWQPEKSKIVHVQVGGSGAVGYGVATILDSVTDEIPIDFVNADGAT